MPPGYIDIPEQSRPDLLGLPRPDKSITYFIRAQDGSVDIAVDIVQSQAGWVVYYTDRNRKNPLAQYLAENPHGDLARQVARHSDRSENLLTIGEFLTANPHGDFAQFLQMHPESDLSAFLASYGEDIIMQWRPVMDMLPGEAAGIVPNTKQLLILDANPAPIELYYDGMKIHFDSDLAEFLLKN